MLSLCGGAGALGMAPDALGDRSAELARGNGLAGLAPVWNAAKMRQAKMVSAVDGSVLPAVVTRWPTDSGHEAAASTIGMATRRSSAPTTALTTARARAPGRGGRTCARAGAASDDAHSGGAGVSGRCSSQARAAHRDEVGDGDVRARSAALAMRAAASRRQGRMHFGRGERRAWGDGA